MLETSFLCFEVWGIIWDHFQKPQIDLKAKDWTERLLEDKKDFKKWNSNLGSNSASEHARDMVVVATPMFWGIGNHLGPFSKASDRP